MAELNKDEINYEAQLRQSERERKDLKNIIYELPVGLVIVKGGNDLRIDTANHEFCRMTGYALSDFSMERKSMAELIHMEDYMMFEDAAEVCRRGKSSCFSSRFMHIEAQCHTILFPAGISQSVRKWKMRSCSSMSVITC